MFVRHVTMAEVVVIAPLSVAPTARVTATMAGIEGLHAHQSHAHTASHTHTASITTTIMVTTEVSIMVAHTALMEMTDHTVLVCLLHLQDAVKDYELGCQASQLNLLYYRGCRLTPLFCHFTVVV